MDVRQIITGILNSTLQPSLSFASNRLTTLSNSINGAASFLGRLYVHVKYQMNSVHATLPVSSMF